MVNRRLDLVILIILPLLSALATLLFRPNYLIAIILFYGLLGIYLAIRHPNRATKHVLWFAAIIAIPFTLIVDYVGTVSELWYVPQSILPFRLFHVIPIEDYLWLVMGTFIVIVFYKWLGGDAPSRRMSTKFIMPFFIAATIFCIAFLGSIRIFPSLYIFHSHYTYLFLASIFFLMPALIFLSQKPRPAKTIISSSLYFLYLTALFEFTATHLQYWIFTGSYLMSPLSILNFGSVPLEELFFVGIVGPIAAIAFYTWCTE